MKRKCLKVIMIASLLGFISIGTHYNKINYKTLLVNNITYSTNDLTSISSANAQNFDNPSISSNGDLNRMPTTQIETKYGNMEIIQQEHGYLCKNLTNPNAPQVEVSAVNAVYEVGDQASAQETIAPKIVSSQSASIILPNIDTSTQGYHQSYVEATSAGGTTIIPFIYNTIEFKNNITVQTANDVKSLTINDVLENTNESSTGLKMYIANYTQGSNSISIGISRGMASVQKELPLQIGNNKTADNAANNNTSNTTNNNTKTTTQANLAKPNVPLIGRILLSKISYIVVGLILIAIVAFFCFL
ncbi:MAG: hypothetical protein ACRC57_14970 [Sarcina sp.]